MNYKAALITAGIVAGFGLFVSLIALSETVSEWFMAPIVVASSAAAIGCIYWVTAGVLEDREYQKDYRG